MPRKKIIRQSEFPYHITTRCNNKDWFALPISDVWTLFLLSLESAQGKCPVIIHCFVLMNNHYHLMITTPEADVDTFMQFLNKRFSDEIGKRSGTINHKFAGRYKWSVIDDQRYLLNCYRYIFQNPVKANLAKRVEEYQFSSLVCNQIRENNFKFNIELDLSFFGRGDFIKWLNEFVSDESYAHLRDGLRKALFQIKTRASNRVKKELLLQ